MISRLHYTSLLDAMAHSSRRLQSIRAVEHTSHIDEVYAPFDVSIQSHNGHRSTIGPFDYQVLHLAFSAEVVILSRMEREQSVRRTCRAVWSSRIVSSATGSTSSHAASNLRVQVLKTASNALNSNGASSSSSGNDDEDSFSSIVTSSVETCVDIKLSVTAPARWRISSLIEFHADRDRLLRRVRIQLVRELPLQFVRQFVVVRR